MAGEEPQKKPTSSIDLAFAIAGFFKDFLLAGAAILLEWSRIQTAKAEDKAAVATAEAKIAVATAAIEKEENAKDPTKTIADFLDSP